MTDNKNSITLVTPTLRAHCVTTKVEYCGADIYGFTEETPGFTSLSTVKVSSF